MHGRQRERERDRETDTDRGKEIEMKDLLDDVNYAITTGGVLEDPENIELLQEAVDNWQELLDQIKREQASLKRMQNRHEFSDVEMAEFGLDI